MSDNKSVVTEEHLESKNDSNDVEPTSSEVKPLNEKLKDMTSATFLARTVAYLIDMIIIWSLLQLIVYPILNILDVEISYVWIPYFSIDAIVFAVMAALYFVLMTYFAQQTIGKMVVGIKVMSSDGDKLSITQVLYREIVGRFINNTVFYLPYLVILFTDRRIGLHDYFADTYVAKEKFIKHERDILPSIPNVQNEKYSDNYASIDSSTK